MSIDALINRVRYPLAEEQAVLNAQVAVACGWLHEGGGWWPPADAEEQVGQDDPPDYFRSFDAAFSVLPKGSQLLRLERELSGNYTALLSWSGELYREEVPSIHAALVMVGLRARQTKGG